MERTSPSKYFDFIQVFRGIAALMVVVHHIYGSFKYFHHIDIAFLDFIASVGKYGVDFFFVLSGFIITYTCYKYGNQRKEIKNYLFNRFVRIYIPYWPVGISLLILYMLFPGFSNGNRSLSLITSIFLYPNGSPALSVAWTLVHEMLFYSLFVIFFISKATWNWFVPFWVLFILFFGIYPQSNLSPVFNVFVSHYNLEFILGFILAAALKKGFRINYHLTLFLAVLCLVIFLILAYFHIKTIPFLLNIIFAIAGVLLIKLAVCYWDRPIGNANLFMSIGNATYSIYLVHNPLQAFLIRFFPKSNGNYMLFYAEFIGLIAICCAVGFVYYLVFEKMLIAKVKAKFSPQR